MTLTITHAAHPTDAQREAILAPLRAYNLREGGDPGLVPVALLLTDADGAELGGLWGKIAYDWLFIELLAVPASHRGQGHGEALMARAEALARTHGCVGIWLDTYAFQARGFYEKLGFAVFGTLADHPRGQSRFFLQKPLAPLAA